MKPLINHQMQPCPVSCVSTCMAMLVNEPVSVTVNRFHDAYRDGSLTLRSMLDRLGLGYTAFYSIDCPAMVDEGAYLCTAPSLNIEAGNHQILIELTDDGYYVHDPVMGRHDRKFYVARGAAPDNPLAVDLGGFIIDAFISREQIEIRRKEFE